MGVRTRDSIEITKERVPRVQSVSVKSVRSRRTCSLIPNQARAQVLKGVIQGTGRSATRVALRKHHRSMT